MLAIFAATAGVVVIRTILTRRALPQEPRVHVDVDSAEIARHLSGAIQFQTVFRDDGPSRAELGRLHEYLAASYPLLHARLVRETIDGSSLLYEWPGEEPRKAPIVLMGHLDVVPVAAGTEHRWTHPPWSGAIAGGFVYGRGALDDKAAVIAILEAVERLVRDGFVPARTIYLAFGADEEIGGTRGARAIMRSLRARRIAEPALVLDEGGSLLVGEVPGYAGRVAVIGIAEKGYVSLELSVRGRGGHSSTPTHPTPIGRLSAAIARLEARPFPARLEPPTVEMLRALAPVQPFGRRLALANLWLFRPLVARQLLASPQMAPLVHTTTAPTIFVAGDTENVIPGEARAIVNFQILTGDSVEGVAERVRQTIADPAVEVEPGPGGLVAPPSPVSDVSGAAFVVLARAVRQTLGEPPPLVVPFLTGPTDSRHWAAAGSRNVFRFTPFLYEKDWGTRAHGSDERIAVQSLAGGVGFYMQLMRNADAF
jgi:carboxypeptidase PM20D1